MAVAFSQPTSRLRGPAVWVEDQQIEREDDLGFPVALLLAIPAGLALWIAIVWVVVRFLF